MKKNKTKNKAKKHKIRTKRISKRKNPILISDDATSITIDELIRHLSEFTQILINDILDGYEFRLRQANLESISVKQLIAIISESFRNFDKDEIKELVKFRDELLKLPQNLEIEIFDYKELPKHFELSHTDLIMKKLKKRHRSLY